MDSTVEQSPQLETGAPRELEPRGPCQDRGRRRQRGSKGTGGLRAWTWRVGGSKAERSGEVNANQPEVRFIGSRDRARRWRRSKASKNNGQTKDPAPAGFFLLGAKKMAQLRWFQTRFAPAALISRRAPSLSPGVISMPRHPRSSTSTAKPSDRASSTVNLTQ